MEDTISLPQMLNVIAATLFLASLGLQYKGSAVFRQMKADVNRMLPPEGQFGDWGPSWNQGRIIKLHRQFYPNSTLSRDLYRWWWAMTAAFIGALACVVRFAG